MSLFGEMNIVHLKTEFFQDLVGQNLTANFAIGDGYKIKVSNLTQLNTVSGNLIANRLKLINRFRHQDRIETLSIASMVFTFSL